MALSTGINYILKSIKLTIDINCNLKVVVVISTSVRSSEPFQTLVLCVLASTDQCHLKNVRLVAKRLTSDQPNHGEM